MSVPLLLQRDFPLQSLNTFGIAARARYYARIESAEQLRQLDQLPELQDLPRLILGGGSNVVLTGDFAGVVLHAALAGREKIGEDAQSILVRAGAGESWHGIVQWTLEQGWGGLENLSLIPGSVGAAPIQNIGAYGVEMKDRFHSLRWFEFATGTIHELHDCGFSYRDSIFKHDLLGQGMILDVTFALPKAWQPMLGYGDIARALGDIARPSPQQVSQAVCAIRRSKLPDPEMIGNVGSFFKNPVVDQSTRDRLLQLFPQLVSYAQPDGDYKLAAGWLIEQCGWKGRSAGAVGMYQRQALVMVNLGSASGADVVALARAIQTDVQNTFGVLLEPEPVFV